jgi:hypothetical protein
MASDQHAQPMSEESPAPLPDEPAPDRDASPISIAPPAPKSPDASDIVARAHEHHSVKKKHTRETLTAARSKHQAEQLQQAKTATGLQRIHTRYDAPRTMWQAWAGDGGWDRAEVRGEWTTELGAIRRMRNGRGRAPATENDGRTSRPMTPADADVHVLDAMIAGREKRAREQPVRVFMRSVWKGVRITLVVSAAATICVMAGAAWMAQRDHVSHDVGAVAARVVESTVPRQAPAPTSPPVAPAPVVAVPPAAEIVTPEMARWRRHHYHP